MDEAAAAAVAGVRASGPPPASAPPPPPPPIMLHFLADKETRKVSVWGGEEGVGLGGVGEGDMEYECRGSVI